MNDPEKKETLEQWKQVVINNHPVGVKRSVNGVIERDGIADKIHQIKMPTLIIVGENDVATIPSKSEKMNSMIKGSKLEIIPDVGHMSVIENPGSVTVMMEKFLRWKINVHTRVDRLVKARSRTAGCAALGMDFPTQNLAFYGQSTSLVIAQQDPFLAVYFLEHLVFSA